MGSTMLTPLYCAVYLAMYYDLKLRRKGTGPLGQDARGNDAVTHRRCELLLRTLAAERSMAKAV